MSRIKESKNKSYGAVLWTPQTGKQEYAFVHHKIVNKVIDTQP